MNPDGKARQNAHAPWPFASQQQPHFGLNYLLDEEIRSEFVALGVQSMMLSALEAGSYTLASEAIYLARDADGSQEHI